MYSFNLFYFISREKRLLWDFDFEATESSAQRARKGLNSAFFLSAWCCNPLRSRQSMFNEITNVSRNEGEEIQMRQFFV